MKERMASMVGESGTTMEFLGRKIMDGKLEGISIELVIADHPNTPPIDRAEILRIPVKIVERNKFKNRNSYGEALLQLFERYRISVVSLNGTLNIIPGNVLNGFNGRIFNQHPGPKKETEKTWGIMPYAIMLEFIHLTGRNEGTDVIIHRVTNQVDEGPTVAISHVPIFEEDTAETLQERGKEVERQLQLEFWENFVKGEVQEVHDTVYMRPGEEHLLRAARLKARKDYPTG
ncbi:MAG: hypothetical protein HY427_01735 [Candidatus Levybacteria bacterium]|nr:hypothetical protein [Candidatus Levybacteria bacterium]